VTKTMGSSLKFKDSPDKWKDSLDERKDSLDARKDALDLWMGASGRVTIALRSAGTALTSIRRPIDFGERR
jgi:hypothetical protein